MILERTKKAVGTIEFFSLSKEAIFGKYQISNQMMLYKTVFLPKLLYNCETWTSLSDNDFSNLQKAQLNYLRRMMEVPRSTPIHGTFLELGILPIQFEIEQRQLIPVLEIYKEMFKYDTERNWANMATCLRKKYDLPLNDTNIAKLAKSQWKCIVKKNKFNERVAFNYLLSSCLSNKKTSYLSYENWKSKNRLQ